MISRLRYNSHIRVIAPSRSLSYVSSRNIEYAKENLRNFGFRLSFGKYVYENDQFNSSSIESRLKDIHEAFQDPDIDGIFTAIGGYNSIQLVNLINYSIIKENPKIICGYSDISIILNAIYFKTGMITYLGPHFSSWSINTNREYTDEYFRKCCFEDSQYEINSSEKWSDSDWHIDQENREFFKNDGHWILKHGKCKALAIGGNLNTISLLFGTEFFDVSNKILYIEDIARIVPEIFDRLFNALLLQKGASKIQGILIGRFLPDSKMTKDILTRIISKNKILGDIPVIGNIDFGHTMPLLTLPIGGEVEIDTNMDSIIITKH